jgi:Sporulation and spore germination
MNVKLSGLLTFLVLVSLTACGTFQVGIEYTPNLVDSPTSALISTATPTQPAPTLAPTGTALPPTLTPLPPTATPLPVEVTPGPQMVQIFLVAVGDDSQSGEMIGCGDSLIPVQVEIPPSQGVLRASMEKLLSLKDQYYGQSGLYNALYQSNLQLESLTLETGKAVINLTGTMTLAGECDNPRVAAQLDATARQFPTVNEVTIFINGKSLAEALSLK